MKREKLEWTNSWWDAPNNLEGRRWLLIGDSVHREYRPILQGICKNLNIYVDLYATSFHIEDDAFQREIEHFFSYSEYKHEIVFIGWGTHHGYTRQTSKSDEVKISYQNSYEKLLRYVMDRCCQVVILAGTPVMKKDNVELLDPDIEVEVVTRNIIAKEIANKYNLPFIDHYKFVLEHRDKMKYRDWKHFFKPQGYSLLVQDLYEQLLQKGIVKANGELSDKIRKDNIVDMHSEENLVNSNTFWLEQYQAMATEVDWLKKKAVVGGEGSSVGYAYLYILIRLLHEFTFRSILEFNFGQVTKLVAQYASYSSSEHTVLECDRGRVEHFLSRWDIDWTRTTIYGSTLIKVKGQGMRGWWYANFPNVTEGKKYNLILLKCPLGGDMWARSHLDILTGIPNILADEFAILVDHVEYGEGEEIFTKIIKSLQSNEIAYSCKLFRTPNCTVGLLASKSMGYLEEY